MQLKHTYKVVEIATRKVIAIYTTPINAILKSCENPNWEVKDCVGGLG